MPTMMNCPHTGEGWCLACVGDMATETTRLRETLSWATGFIRCAHPNAESDYADMRNAMDLIAGRVGTSGEFHRTCCRAELAETERDEARAECERLTKCLTAANAQAEKFEREWYLRGDECEQLRATLADIASSPCSDSRSVVMARVALKGGGS